MKRRDFLVRAAAATAVYGAVGIARADKITDPSPRVRESGSSIYYNDPTDPWGWGLRPEQDRVLTSPFPGQPDVIETLNVWCYDDKRDIGFNIHPHKIQNGVMAQVKVTVFLPDGRILNLRNDEPVRFTNPAKPRSEHVLYHCLQPFREWNYQLDDLPVWETSREELNAGVVDDTEPTGRVSLQAHALMAAPIYLQGGMLPEANQAIDSEVGLWLAARFRDGRSPEAFRFDQMFRAEGSLTFEGRTWDFDGYGLRGHVRGVRVMTEMYGHTWLGGLMPSGTAFGVQLYPRPGGGFHFSEAYVYKGGRMYPCRINYAPSMDYDPDEGDYVIELACDELGLTRIVGRDKRVFWWSMPGWGQPFQWGISPDAPTVMRQATAEYELDGEVGYGMNERSGPRPDIKC